MKTHRSLLPLRLSFKKGASLFLLATFIYVGATDSQPTPTPSPEHRALAEKLAATTNPAEQDSLIEHAGDALLQGHALRYALLDIAFHRSLEGKYVEAEKVDRMIIHIGEHLHDPAMIAAGQTMAGGVLRETGDYSEGLSLLRQAADYYDRQQPGPSVEKMSVSQALGITYLYQGNFRRALASLERTLKIAKELHQPKGVIPALNSMGEVCRAQGQPERALQFYERAREEVGDDSKWNMAFIFNNIGMAYEAMGDNTKAIEYLNRARAVAEKAKLQPRVASALTELGNVHLRAREVDAARRSFQQSMELSLELHDRSNEARAHVGLANVARAEDDFAAALLHAAKAAEIYRALQEHDSVAGVQTLVGQCLNSLGKKEDARLAFEEAVAEIEHVRGQLAGGAEEAESFLADRIAPYQELVALFANAHRNEDALAIAQRASARALLDILAKGKTAPPTNTNEQIRGLEQRIAEANRRLIDELRSGKPSDTQLVRLRAELRDARMQRENADFEDGSENQRETKPLAIASLAEMQRLVKDEKAALLKFVVTKDETFLFVLNGNDEDVSPQVFRIDLSRDQLTKRASSFRSLIADRGLDWQTPARALYASLLQESESAWKNSRRLIIIPDGALWDLPFQTLQDSNKHCLIEDRAISYAPSITFLTRIRTSTSHENKNSPRLFAVANPALRDVAKRSGSEKILVSSGPQLMGEIWQPLPEAEKQVAELKELYRSPASVVLTGPDARERTFKSRAGDFDIIHLATHGVLNDHAPLYSYLLMSQENLEADEDGLLEAWELMQMKLHARLAVLSACETARGKVSEGEGVIGLSWALLAAGCSSEIVSQWKVDSASNTELMMEFHRRYRNSEDAANALRGASLALAKNPRYRHPFYWAPFVAIGE
jgi:CHAT domain-containing protein/Tfp pilus assembly protein PilF